MEGEQNKNESIGRTLLNICKSFIFDLPFKNYHDYYKTGIIQKMTKEEKIKFMLEMNLERQHRQFFYYFINIRPNILDDEDLFEYKEVAYKNKIYQYWLLGGFFLNWSYFTYNFFIKKRFVYKPLILINGALLIAYLKVNTILNNYQESLFNKYKNILKREDLLGKVKESYRFDKN